MKQLFAIAAGGTRKRLRPDSPRILIAVGFVLIVGYDVLALNLVPLPYIFSDNEHFRHWADSNYKYSSSPFDFGVMSPYQGLGGLDQPLGVWINPSFIVPHLMPFGDPRVWTYLVNFILLFVATLMLARAMGVPTVVAIMGAQVFVFLYCLPGCACALWITRFTGADFDMMLPHLITPIALLTLAAVIFSCIGRSAGRFDLLLLFAFPWVIVYAVLCDPLYTANSLVCFGFLCAGIYFGDTSPHTFRWRTAAGLWSVIVFLAIRLPTFYMALAGYCARASFRNEIYVEVQRWDFLTGLLFQGGVGTLFCFLVIFSSVFLIIRGSALARGIAGGVLAFQVFIGILSFTYVYSGIRWNWPAPLYLETTAYPAYVVVILLAVPLAWRAAIQTLRGLGWNWMGALWRSPVRYQQGEGLLSTYRNVGAVPLIGIIFVLLTHHCKMPYISDLPDTRLYPVRGAAAYFEQLAIDRSGRFRGSVATVVGVPERAPFTKANIENIELYFRYNDPHASMCGLWDVGVPTLEDNNHLVTPPFYFLFSRALSRPEDYHSRNWTMATRVRPALMAALGVRFLLTDAPQTDPRLTLRLTQKNPDGLILYVYEIAGTNVGDVSPVRTFQSEDAKETIGMLISDDFQFHDEAVVDGPPITGLVHASLGEMFYERGGVRVSAETTGRSLLILPLQFSNSLKIISIKDNSESCAIRLIRTNLLETGVLFQGRINVKIAHVFGLFRALNGRLRDIDDCRRLNIVENGDVSYPPGYQPLAHKESGVLRDLFYPKADH